MANSVKKIVNIKRPLPKIQEEVLGEIKQQIEFYFSMANLATDKVLKRMMQSNHRGWVKIKQLAKFNLLRTLIIKAFQRLATPKEIEHLISISLQDSNTLMVVKDRIKLKRHVVWEKEEKKVLYFEGEQLNQQILEEMLRSIEIHRQDYAIKSGHNWFFVEFTKLGEMEVVDVYYQLQPQCLERKFKILKMHQFLDFQKRYNQLFTVEHDPDLKTIITIPPQQMIRYDEVQVKIRPKVPEVALESKKIDYEKIFSRYIKSRNKKTPEAYEKHRAEKIAQKQRKKAERLNQGIQKMQIQQ